MCLNLLFTFPWKIFGCRLGFDSAQPKRPSFLRETKTYGLLTLLSTYSNKIILRWKQGFLNVIPVYKMYTRICIMYT